MFRRNHRYREQYVLVLRRLNKELSRRTWAVCKTEAERVWGKSSEDIIHVENQSSYKQQKRVLASTTPWAQTLRSLLVGSPVTLDPRIQCASWWFNHLSMLVSPTTVESSCDQWLWFIPISLPMPLIGALVELHKTFLDSSGTEVK